MLLPLVNSVSLWARGSPWRLERGSGPRPLRHWLNPEAGPCLPEAGQPIEECKKAGAGSFGELFTGEDLD
jgi:hypothetical protein